MVLMAQTSHPENDLAAIVRDKTIEAPPRVALADDHEDILEEVRSLLEPEFQVVCSSTEGAALVEAVHSSKPDCVVADVQMPGMTGIEAGKEIVRRGLC